MNLKKKNLIDTYRKIQTAGTFDETRSMYQFQKYKHLIESNFLKKAIKELPHKKLKILDVGCGTGRMLSEAFSMEKDIKYVGIDTSKEMITFLKNKSKKIGVENKVNTIIGDASKIPFGNDSFDIVFSFHLLWHLPKKDQKEILEEMLRVCKKGGFIVFDILNKEFIWEKIKILINKPKTEGIYKLTPKEIKQIFKSDNFKIEKLNDFPIKNDNFYRIFNIQNRIRKILPKSLYHMIFFRVKK